jgi:hypothetical protein
LRQRFAHQAAGSRRYADRRYAANDFLRLSALSRVSSTDIDPFPVECSLINLATRPESAGHWHFFVIND